MPFYWFSLFFPFQLLELPISRKGSSSQSGSTTSTTTSSPTTQSPPSLISGTPDFHYNHTHANQHHLHRVHYIQSPHRNTIKQTSPPNSNKSSSSKSGSVDSYSLGQDISVRDDPSISCKSDQVLLETDTIDPYVVFNRNSPHEYSYPNLESVQKPPTKRESMSSVKKHQFPNSPPLPVRKKKDKVKSNQRGPLIKTARCKHCHELFSYSENQRGSCEEAPDAAEKAIELVSCVMCAKGLIYHCMSDADGEYGHPCACDSADESNCKKWTALTILSFFVPCLWCYWPLLACHKCAVACGCCGGRHTAA